jgi:hypothetical protein
LVVVVVVVRLRERRELGLAGYRCRAGDSILVVSAGDIESRFLVALRVASSLTVVLVVKVLLPCVRRAPTSDVRLAGFGFARRSRRVPPTKNKRKAAAGGTGGNVQ